MKAAPQESYPTYPDEIDLFQLCADLWGKRWWIAGITAISVLIAVLYLWVTPPVYKVTAYIKSANPTNFIVINQSGVDKITPDDAFRVFRENTLSKEVRRRFFNIAEIKSGFVSDETTLTDDQLFMRFDESLVLTDIGKEEDGASEVRNASIAMEHRDPQYAAKVVNEFIAFSESLSVKGFLEDFEEKRTKKLDFNKNKITEIIAFAEEERRNEIIVLTEKNKLALSKAEDELAALQAKAKNKREDRIMVLSEAVSIASKLNIIRPTTLSEQIETQSSVGAVSTEINNYDQRNELLYFLGVNFLNAELEALMQRKTDDFSDSNIREKLSQIELLRKARKIETLLARSDDKAFVIDKIGPFLQQVEHLKRLDIDFSSVEFSRVDGPPVIPNKPLSPKRSLIVSLSLVLGAMVGMFVALILLGIEKRTRVSA